MTYPRSHLVDPNGGTYHVYSRCVRRAYLCGTDSLTGKNFSHRRAWLEKRIHKLSNLFSIDLIGYAVMSNHYHIILRVQPERVDSWSDLEVARKWFDIFPRKTPFANRIAIDELTSDSEKLSLIRSRLSSLSWFMRCLNEPLARWANKEDDCKGRFWEGRFRSQRILDEASLLACMAYVDLNPVRAGISKSPARSRFTSIHHRVRNGGLEQVLTTLNTDSAKLDLSCTLGEYLELLKWINRDIKTTTKKELKILQNTQTNSSSFIKDLMPKPGTWQRAIGSPKAIEDYATSINQKRIIQYYKRAA